MRCTSVTAPATPLPSLPAPGGVSRPYVRGKFLYRDGRKFYVRGVTYGPFAPGPDGEPYARATVERDFAQIVVALVALGLAAALDGALIAAAVLAALAGALGVRTAIEAASVTAAVVRTLAPGRWVG